MVKMILFNIIKKITPPILFDSIKKYKKNKFGWSGDFDSWESAKNKSTGYSNENILLKVKDSIQKVIDGKALFERDSVLLNQKEFSYPLLTTLLFVSTKNDLELNLIDFGGSLGSSYFQCKDFLHFLKRVQWNIIEQRNFVECGKRDFENESLRFFFDIDSCLASSRPNLFILSSTLQYLENPLELLDTINKLKFEYILFERTPFWKDRDTITLQKVSQDIYDASYPCWIFNLEKFKNYFSEDYELLFITPSIHCEQTVNNKLVKNMSILFSHK
jgi:putative methyltransferase (TIGR04325 family)